MKIHPPALLTAWLLSAALGAQATTLPLAADDGWQAFTVDALSAQSGGTEWIVADDSLSADFGSPLSFSFTVAAGQTARLSIIDAGFAGDTYTVSSAGKTLGSTSAVPVVVYGDATPAEFDFDAAWANPAYSRGVFTLGAGSYSIGGRLAQSVLLGDGSRLDSSFGGIRLSVSPVPEPANWAMLAGGLLAIVFVARRRG